MQPAPHFVLALALVVSLTVAVAAWAEVDPSLPSQAPEPTAPWVTEVEALIDQQAFEQARQRLAMARLSGADPDRVAVLAKVLDAQQEAQLAALSRELDALIDDQDLDQAQQVLVQLIALGADQTTIVAHRQAIDNRLRYGRHQPGEVFHDPWLQATPDETRHPPHGPAMVVLPQGRFMMGSGRFEKGHKDNEAPRHRVTIASGFAVGQTEITVGQFRAFVEATGHRSDAERRGRASVYDPRTRRITERPGMDWRLDFTGQRADDAHPVIRVSWRDAQAYVAWLSEMTGERYRLLSEAEFEYALRAGQQWRFPWGEDTPHEAVENVAGEADRSPTNARWAVSLPDYGDGHWGPAPVGRFQANDFGLFDMGGNVSEWTQDCWHDNFVRAPKDGSAWVNQGCDQRVVRGGAWTSTPALARAAHRRARPNDWADVRVGFRVARELAP